MAKITTHYKGDMLFESSLGSQSLVIDAPPSMGGAAHGKLGGRSTDLCRTDSGRRGDNANRETFAGSQ